MKNILIFDTESAGIGTSLLLRKKGYNVTLTDQVAEGQRSLARKPDLVIIEPFQYGRAEQEVLGHHTQEPIRNINPPLSSFLSDATSKSYVVICSRHPEEVLEPTYSLRQGDHYHQYFGKPKDPKDLIRGIEFSLQE